jgi:hypothetical protein
MGVIYVAGSGNLMIGSRYVLQLEDGVLRVIGPLETAPHHTCIERPVDQLDISVVNGQVLLTTRHEPHLALGFNTMPGEDPGRFERAFNHRSGPEGTA